MTLYRIFQGIEEPSRIDEEGNPPQADKFYYEPVGYGFRTLFSEPLDSYLDAEIEVEFIARHGDEQ